METLIDGLKTFLKSRNSHIDLRENLCFDVRLSARIKVPCDIQTRILNSDDWLKEMKFVDVSFREEGMETSSIRFLNESESTDGFHGMTEFLNGALSKIIINKKSAEEPQASEKLQPLEEVHSLEVPLEDSDYSEQHKKLESDKILDSNNSNNEIYIDVAQIENIVVKEEVISETNQSSKDLGSGSSESFENTEDNIQNGSNGDVLDEDDINIPEDEAKKDDSDGSWHPDEEKETDNLIRKKTKSSRRKRKSPVKIPNSYSVIPEADSNSKLKRKRTPKNVQELENSDKSLKTKRSRRQKNVKASKIVEEEDHVDISEQKTEDVNHQKWERCKVTCIFCRDQFDEIKAYNIHLDEHSNMLAIPESEDGNVGSIMRLDVPQLEMMERDTQENESTNLNNLNEGVEVILLELPDEGIEKTDQEQIPESRELQHNHGDLLKKPVEIVDEPIIDTEISKLSEETKQNENNTISSLTSDMQSSIVSQTTTQKDYDILRCPYCDKKFSKIILYNKHIAIHSSIRPFSCQRCESTFKTEQNLKMHMYNVHKDKRFPCEACDKSFKYKVSLQRHFTSSHKMVQPHICHICGKGYYSKSSLVDHISRHSKDKPFKCDVCGNSYHSAKLLSQHSFHHFAQLKHQCDQCGKSFKTLGNLQRHLEQHASVRNYVCEICDMAFTLKRYYARHRITHDPQRVVFKCDVCFKKFSSKTNLDRHKRSSHSDAKPFECDICSKAFKLKYLLQQHVRVHKEEKDFICKFCKKKFSFNSSLHSHIKHHHRNENIESKTTDATFKCKICDNTFYSKSALASHLKFHQS